MQPFLTTFQIPGNIKVFCRTRPLFEDEGSSVVEYPDNCNIRVATGHDALSNPKKDFELDRVYGPHVGQGEKNLLFFHCFLLHIVVVWTLKSNIYHILLLYSMCVAKVSLSLFCFQLNFSVMFSHWCNRRWMDIMFPYLLMGKPTQERRTLWLLSFPLFFSLFLFSYSFYFVSLSACDAWWTALLLSSPYNFKCSIKKLSN